MGHPILCHLERLCQKDPEARRRALEDVLTAEGLEWQIQRQEPSFQLPMGVTNYLLPSSEAELLFCAHYDSMLGSFGANDNAAAVCILIALACELRSRHIPAHFAFFDGEESGRAGSRYYAQTLDRSKVRGILNLDLCGYGDTIAICGRGYEKKSPLKLFCQKELLKKYRAQVVAYLPDGDDVSFVGMRIPVLSLSVVPRWDVQYLKALAGFKGSFLGKPPEYTMILGQMEISTTMHGGFRDEPKWVQPEAAKTVYQYLLEAINSI